MISDWFQIGDKKYDVKIMSITETANTLYSENTGRTISQGSRITLDPLGTFIGHTVTVRKSGNNLADFDELFNFAIKPRRNGVTVKCIHNQTTIEYEAYLSATERNLKYIDDKTKKIYWDEITITMTPMEAQLLPDD